MRAFFNGIVFTVVLLIAAGIAAVVLGVVPAGADSKPGFMEKTAANMSLHAAISRDVAALNNPLQPTDANLLAAVKLYGANCAFCHGTADAKPSIPAQGFYIDAPQLAKDGVEDDPEAVTYWKLKHGIRFTAMPSFGSTQNDDDLWKLSMFLKQMDKLPPAVEGAWKALPSSAGSATASSEAASPAPVTTPGESPAPRPETTVEATSSP
ncbi:MAG: c-type cytochrome [Vulcanimicrobiaceae bacterium]